MRQSLGLLSVWALLLASNLASANPPFARPFQSSDYGWVQRQSIHVFAVKENHVLLNARALHRDLRLFQEAPLDAYSYLLSNAGLTYLTHLQKAWEGILMETFEEPIADGDAIHPFGYVRGSVVFPRLTLSLHGGPPQEIPLGAIDAKGSGLSPEGEAKLQLYHSALEVVLGKDGQGVEALDFRRYIASLEAHRDNLRRRREEVRNRRPDTDLGRNNRDKAMEQVEGELKVTQFLLLGMTQMKQGRKVEESLKNKILEALRGLDYTNGLMPLDRAVKEFLMGIFWEIYFARYNAVHGTNLSVVTAYAVMPLPVNILEPKGTKRRAGVLIRRPHWRNHTNNDFAQMFPQAMVDPVIGGIQTDIFGAMVDLELPGFQLEPAKSLLGWRGFLGHPIDRRAREVTDKWMAGDPKPLNDLIAEVTKFAEETPIPEKPLEVKGKLKETSLRFRALLEKLARQQAPITAADRTEAEALLDHDELAGSEKNTLLTKIASMDSDAGIAFVRRELGKLKARLDSVRRASGSSLSVDLSEVAGAITVLLQRFDPMAFSAGQAEALYADLFALPHNLYVAFVKRLARSVYVALAHDLDLKDILFEEHSTLWELTEQLILAFVQLDQRDRTTAADVTLKTDDLTFENPISRDPLTFKRLLQLTRSPAMIPTVHHALMTAERFTGRSMPDRVLAVFDPTDWMRLRETRQLQAQEKKFIDGHVQALIARHGVDRNCAFQIVQEALMRGQIQSPVVWPEPRPFEPPPED